MNSLKGRIIKDKLFTFLVVSVSFTAVLPLFIILIQLFQKGVKAINLHFLLSLPKPPPEAGGIFNSIVGTLILITIASAIAIPIGITAGIYLSESENKFARFAEVLVNTLQGVPSIVIGILAYLLVVKPMGRFSGFSGGLALGIMMLPSIITNTEENLKLIPFSIKEASYALGGNYTKTILKIVLPSGMRGILSGILIGIARIAGETAPLLFTTLGNPYLNTNPSKPMDTLPLLIFNYVMSPYKKWHDVAWGASLVLVAMILFLIIIVKMVGRRWKTQF
ncbi:phosphate ABC transporter permease PstA [candidate division WOR-3 bacterium]|nr:phosphate ABC transporter permease PstA [candidate division WOR-3 bacterium]